MGRRRRARHQGRPRHARCAAIARARSRPSRCRSRTDRRVARRDPRAPRGSAGASFLVGDRAGTPPNGARAARDRDRARCGTSCGPALVTNDTFAPLRSLARAGVAPRATAHASFGGRWSLVRIARPAPTATARAHALRDRPARALGHRLPRRRARRRPARRLRRGRRRPARDGGCRHRAPRLLRRERSKARSSRGPARSIGCASRRAATRSASRCSPRSIRRTRGAAPCPGRSSRDPDAHAGAARRRHVVLVDGALALFIEPKAQAPRDRRRLPAETIALALAVGLPQLAARARRRELLIETIDGEPAGAVAAGEGPARRRRAHRLPRPRRARDGARGVVRPSPSPSPSPSPNLRTTTSSRMRDHA